MMRSAIGIIGVALGLASLLLLRPALGRGKSDLGPRPPGQFDFYALSLTWVPEFCAEPQHHDPEECGRGLGFALHGLWPESIDGYPSSCSGQTLPDDVRLSYQGLYASPGLIDHEWQVHGVCSGLGPAGFLQATSTFFNRVNLPVDLQQERPLASSEADSLKAEIIAANTGLSNDSIVLVCDGNHIKEMHICISKDGAPRACADWERSEENCR